MFSADKESETVSGTNTAKPSSETLRSQAIPCPALEVAVRTHYLVTSLVIVLQDQSVAYLHFG